MGTDLLGFTNEIFSFSEKNKYYKEENGKELLQYN